jgi:RNA polymerase sigma-70 factor (ECF subfamily)
LKGDEKAFKLLYDSYKGYCYTITVRYGIEPEERKDCMQIVFTELFKSLKKYDSTQASFKTWMTRLTINQINNYRRKKRIPVLRMHNPTEEHDSFGKVEQVNHVDNNYILTVLSKMPEQLLIVFNMAIVDGYSHQEIATELNITESASRVTLHRARQWAMERLKSLEFKAAHQTNTEQG